MEVIFLTRQSVFIESISPHLKLEWLGCGVASSATSDRIDRLTAKTSHFGLYLATQQPPTFMGHSPALVPLSGKKVPLPTALMVQRR
jgi:hypothetical protein